MRILRPIQSNKVTQKFGESKACLRLAPPKIIAPKTEETCPTNWVDFYQSMGMKGHNGVDFKSYHGEPLYFPIFAENKFFIKNEVDPGGGIGINVFSDGPINGEHVKFRFWHLKESILEDGDFVTPGQLMGYCDSTGASTRDHLHFDMKYVESDGTTRNKDNGYFGCVDVWQYFENKFVLDELGIKAPSQPWWIGLLEFLRLR